MRRIILPALIAMPFAFGAQAANLSEPASPGLLGQIASGSILPDFFRQGDAGETVRLAQAGDPRVIALEEQVRRLSGTIEELNFQILQMQEQLRKMQEDNEFRFQQLEGNRTDAGPRPGTAPRDSAAAPNGNGAPAAGSPAPGNQNAGAPRTFGTITFDQNGNATGGGVGPAPGGNAAGAPAQRDDTTVAALPATDDPKELYQNSYQFILAGDYKTAERGFRDFIDRFPKSADIADANFWLGEAVLSQERYRDAAQIFLAASRDYPKARKAPDMLLKLGISLAAMNQKDVACATFTEVTMRYPNASDALKERVKKEKGSAGC